jgi:CBS domain-containing protein
MVPLDRLATVRPQDTLVDALAELDRRRARRALVIEDGTLAGLLSTTDALRIVDLLRDR